MILNSRLETETKDLTLNQPWKSRSRTLAAYSDGSLCAEVFLSSVYVSKCRHHDVMLYQFKDVQQNRCLNGVQPVYHSKRVPADVTVVTLAHLTDAAHGDWLIVDSQTVTGWFDVMLRLQTTICYQHHVLDVEPIVWRHHFCRMVNSPLAGVASAFRDHCDCCCFSICVII